MKTQRIIVPFSAQSTAAEVIKGIDLGGKRAIDLATARHPQTLLATHFNMRDCFFPSKQAEERYLLAETYDPKASIDTIVQ